MYYKVDLFDEPDEEIMEIFTKLSTIILSQKVKRIRSQVFYPLLYGKKPFGVDGDLLHYEQF